MLWRIHGFLFPDVKLKPNAWLKYLEHGSICGSIRMECDPINGCCVANGYAKTEREKYLVEANVREMITYLV